MPFGKSPIGCQSFSTICARMEVAALIASTKMRRMCFNRRMILLKIGATQESYSSSAYFRAMRIARLSIVLLFLASQAFAQGYRGRDFWLAFPQNAIVECNK